MPWLINREPILPDSILSSQQDRYDCGWAPRLNPGANCSHPKTTRYTEGWTRGSRGPLHGLWNVFGGPSFFRDKRITTAVRISRDSAQGSNGARPAILFYFNMRGFLVMKLSSILKGLLITCTGVSQVLLIAPPGRLSSCESSAVQPLPPTTLHRSACSVLWLHPCNKMELSRTFQRLIRLY